MKKDTKNDMTELVFILDRSGSMNPLAADTIGGFNSMIEKQKREAGRAFVTTVLFDTEMERIHDRLDLDKVPVLTNREYVPGGCTALLDAVGFTIKHIAKIHRYAQPEDVPAKTVFVITTDGLENASRCFSRAKVKQMIEHEQEKYGWEFLFLGANIDAAETASDIGIRRDRAANFYADSMGVELSFASVSEAVSTARSGRMFSPSWKAKVEENYFSHCDD